MADQNPTKRCFVSADLGDDFWFDHIKIQSNDTELNDFVIRLTCQQDLAGVPVVRLLHLQDVDIDRAAVELFQCHGHVEIVSQQRPLWFRNLFSGDLCKRADFRLLRKEQQSEVVQSELVRISIHKLVFLKSSANKGKNEKRLTVKARKGYDL